MRKRDCAAAFLAGAAVGVVATWRFFERKYRRVANEEIASVKAAFRREKAKSQADTAREQDAGDVTETYEELIRQYSGSAKDPENVEIPASEKPYIISQEQFGELEDYDTISFTYYANGVLVDENDDVIEDTDGLVGEDSLSHFDRYGSEAIFVRNDRLKCDCEILRDLNDYEEPEPY